MKDDSGRMERERESERERERERIRDDGWERDCVREWGKMNFGKEMELWNKEKEAK